MALIDNLFWGISGAKDFAGNTGVEFCGWNAGVLWVGYLSGWYFNIYCILITGIKYYIVIKSQ